MSSLSAVSWAHLFELDLYSEREHTGKAAAAIEVSGDHLFRKETKLSSQDSHHATLGTTPLVFVPENALMTADYEEIHHFLLCVHRTSRRWLLVRMVFLFPSAAKIQIFLPLELNYFYVCFISKFSRGLTKSKEGNIPSSYLWNTISIFRFQDVEQLVLNF